MRFIPGAAAYSGSELWHPVFPGIRTSKSVTVKETDQSYSRVKHVREFPDQSYSRVKHIREFLHHSFKQEKGIP